MIRLALVAAGAQAADLLTLAWAVDFRYWGADLNPIPGILGNFPLLVLYKAAVTAICLFMAFALARLGHRSMALIGIAVVIAGGLFGAYSNLR